jgi:tetratricopeptide (TPR) repeat protein
MSLLKRLVVWSLPLLVFLGLFLFFIEKRSSPVPSPSSPLSLHTRTGERLLFEERHDDALREFAQALESGEDTGRVRYNIGRLNFIRGRYREAEQELTRAIAANPDMPEAHDLLAQVIFRRFKVSPADTPLTAAIASEERAIHLTPERPTFRYNLGNLYAHAGRSTDAEREYLTALSADSTLLPIYYRLGKLYQYQGRLDAARDIYERGLHLDPDDPDLWYGLGIVLERSGRLQEATSAYRRAAMLDPDLTEAHLNLGRLLIRLGNTVEGKAELAYFERTRQDDVASLIALAEARPDDPVLHLRLAAAYARDRHFTEAEAVYHRMMSFSPSSVEPVAGLIALYRENGREAPAESLMTVALRRFPGHPRLLEEQALLSLHRRRYPDAIRLLTDLIERFPDRGDLYLSLGRAEIRVGDVSNAAIHLRRALDLRPDRQDLLIDLVSIDLQLGRLNEAVVHGEEAVRRNPRSWKAYAVLSAAYTTAGRIQDGARMSAKAERLRQKALLEGIP